MTSASTIRPLVSATPRPASTPVSTAATSPVKVKKDLPPRPVPKRISIQLRSLQNLVGCRDHGRYRECFEDTQRGYMLRHCRASDSGENAVMHIGDHQGIHKVLAGEFLANVDGILHSGHIALDQGNVFTGADRLCGHDLDFGNLDHLIGRVDTAGDTGKFNHSNCNSHINPSLSQ